MSNWLPAIMATLAIAFLSFVLGSGTSYLNLPPGNAFHDAFRAAEALYVQKNSFKTPYATHLWQPTFHDFSGIGRNDPDAAQQGYTLFTSGNRQGAQLIDMQGEVVHQWDMPFYSVWPDAEHLSQRPADDFIAWRKAMVWPNGDLLALYIAEGITPWGMGVIKLDKDSNLIWKYPGKAHHDFDIAPDGRIYLLTHEIRNNPIAGLPRIAPPFLDDRVVVLDAEGNELADVGILEAFIGSPYQDFLRGVPRSPIGDYLHVNAIEVMTEALTTAHPYAQPGEVLVSMRQPNLLAVINPDSGKVTWAKRGPWIGQHDPDFLPNGNVLLFDNRGRMAAGGISRVLEFNPASGGITWQYEGNADEPFQSGLRSGQQRLANGNTLITESDRGRLLEVNTAGNVVWEYVNPDRGGPNNGHIPVLMWGQRYLPEQIAFLKATTTGDTEE